LAAAIVAVTAAADQREPFDYNPLYPACLEDDDCLKVHHLPDYACFRYFCYPWKAALKSSTAGQNQAELGPLKACGRRLPACEAPHECLHHPLRRQVPVSVCAPPEAAARCDRHEDCEGDLGGRCCNSRCCTEGYFQKLGELECNNDEACQVR